MALSFIDKNLHQGAIKGKLFMPFDPAFLPLGHILRKCSHKFITKGCILKCSLQHYPKALKMGKLEQHTNTWDKCPKYIKVKKANKTICITIIF